MKVFQLLIVLLVYTNLAIAEDKSSMMAYTPSALAISSGAYLSAEAGFLYRSTKTNLLITSDSVGYVIRDPYLVQRIREVEEQIEVLSKNPPHQKIAHLLEDLRKKQNGWILLAKQQHKILKITYPSNVKAKPYLEGVKEFTRLAEQDNSYLIGIQRVKGEDPYILDMRNQSMRDLEQAKLRQLKMRTSLKSGLLLLGIGAVTTYMTPAKLEQHTAANPSSVLDANTSRADQ